MMPGHLVVRDLQQVQHDLVGVHVLQQSLLFLPHLLPHPTHLVQPLQDLQGSGDGWELRPPPQGPLGVSLLASCSHTQYPTGTGEGKGLSTVAAESGHLGKLAEGLKSHPAHKVGSNMAVKWNLIKVLQP